MFVRGAPGHCVHLRTLAVGLEPSSRSTGLAFHELVEHLLRQLRDGYPAGLRIGFEPRAGGRRHPELHHRRVPAPAGQRLPAGEASSTGQRYIHHSERGSHVLLFVRETKTDTLGAAPYIFLGPADYVSREGERPMAITRRLHRAMPAEVYLGARAAVA